MRDNVNFQHVQYETDLEGRFLLLLCSLDSIPFTVLSNYAPNSWQLKFLRNLLQQIKSMHSGHILLEEDFNTIGELRMGTVSAKKNSLNNFLHKQDLYDV